MSKHPLLDELRARRARLEAEVRAPVEARLRLSEGGRREAMSRLDQIKQLLRGPIQDAVAASIADQIARLSIETISLAVGEAMKRAGINRQAEVRIPLEAIRFLAPREVERLVLDKFLTEALPRMAVGPMTVGETVTVLAVDVPSMHCQPVISDSRGG